jgi:hypothetical protein
MNKAMVNLQLKDAKIKEIKKVSIAKYLTRD